MQGTYQRLIAKAKEVQKNAYAPYSNFKVGACAIFESGNTYTGCNVENSSYGLSLCAERNALSNAIASGEKTKLVAIAIYSDKMPLCSPCGACRQWIFDFNQDAKIILEDKDKISKVLDIKELLPYGFVI